MVGPAMKIHPTQSYLTSYHYTCLPQARLASKITLFTGKDQSRIKNGKKGWRFPDFVLNIQAQKAISYHQLVPCQILYPGIVKMKDLTPVPFIHSSSIVFEEEYK